MRKFAAALLFLFTASVAFGQSAIIRGEVSAGSYENIKTDGAQRISVSIGAAPATVPVSGTVTVSGAVTTSGTVTNTPVSTDPCQSSAVAKSRAAISVTTATTTALVAPSASTTVYVCGFTISISQVVTTANTIKFVRGTGGACVTGPTDLTGAFGTGGVTAAAPIVVSSGTGGTQFATNAADGLCVTTTIGASAAFMGYVTFVQQ